MARELQSDFATQAWLIDERLRHELVWITDFRLDTLLEHEDEAC